RPCSRPVLRLRATPAPPTAERSAPSSGSKHGCHPSTCRSPPPDPTQSIHQTYAPLRPRDQKAHDATEPRRLPELSALPPRLHPPAHSPSAGSSSTSPPSSAPCPGYHDPHPEATR